MRGVCSVCNREAKFHVNDRCKYCCQESLRFYKLKKIEECFIPLNDYNKQIFHLYLTYIRRRRVYSHHVKTTTALVAVLQVENIPVITSWLDISILSEKYLIMDIPANLYGCAFYKIGDILFEIGVIPSLKNDIDYHVNHYLSFFSSPEIKDYANSLLKINTAMKTVVNILCMLIKLENFSRQNFKITSLTQLNEFHIAQFLDQQMKQINSLVNKRKLFLNIRRFYRWAILNKYIIINPVPNMILKKPPGRLLICSEEKLVQIEKYIKNKETNPERALLLTLVIFFGFSTHQLAESQLVVQGNILYIKIKRSKLTKGKKYYNRKELLELPQNPKWFFDLQKRFFTNWSCHYQNLIKPYPNSPLLLPMHNLHNRSLSTPVARKRVIEATIEATGCSIPIRVLRQTCGHIYASKADSSILSSLGWSEDCAFSYSWLPRTFYQ